LQPGPDRDATQLSLRPVLKTPLGPAMKNALVIQKPNAKPDKKAAVIRLPPSSIGVRYETQLCDRHGKVERVLQRGHNTITNWGMDQLASQSVTDLISYLVLSFSQDTRKRSLQAGNNLTVTYTSPTNIAVVADS